MSNKFLTKIDPTRLRTLKRSSHNHHPFNFFDVAIHANDILF